MRFSDDSVVASFFRGPPCTRMYLGGGRQSVDVVLRAGGIRFSPVEVKLLQHIRVFVTRSSRYVCHTQPPLNHVTRCNTHSLSLSSFAVAGIGFKNLAGTAPREGLYCSPWEDTGIFQRVPNEGFFWGGGRKSPSN